MKVTEYVYEDYRPEMLTTLGDYFAGIERFRKVHHRDPDCGDMEDVKLVARYEIEAWKERMNG